MLGAIATFVLLPTASAQAHPLGNFTINHYHGLELHPDRLDVLSIVDSAEIPTAQELQSLAPDGSPTDDQLADAARTQCADLSTEVTASVDGQSLSWTVLSTNLESVPGAAGLPTLRLTCELRADADFSQPRILEFADGYRDDRVGWHEITADGVGVRLLDPPVGSVSTSDELRTYPTDLLFSPLDERSVSLATTPGENSDSGSSSGAGVSRSSGDPFSSLIATLDRFLEDLIGGELTLLVGTLAVLLAVLLGAGHALLPGHGKTMIAAYLAARRGRSRDAVIVGATVTATHTAGVLMLGLAISLSSTLAGEDVLRWLGIISGLLVAGIGAYMLVGAVRNRRAVRRAYAERPPVDAPMALVGAPVGTGHTHGFVHDHDQSNGRDHGHGHGHSHDHGHERAVDHDHDHDHRQVRDAVPAGVASGGHSHGHADGAAHKHGREHSHTHADGAAHEHSHGGSWWSGGHSHGPSVGRGGLIGMGVAGGLVPSPSALIVLVASIALGRTVFGVFLVIAYGLGMAATLTVAGLLLVRLRGRLDRRAARRNTDGSRSWLAAVSAALPIITATLVLVVGLGLALRGLLLGG